jgi:tRNA (mo5U34)-methyltransferase
MTSGEAQARIEEPKPWLHTVDCGNGVVIPRDPRYGPDADYPRQLWSRPRALLPADLPGASVLDVGCNSGFFSVEIERAGAARVVGIDSVPRHLEQAKLVRELSGANINLRLMSIYDLSGALGEFDITLCLGVVYHLKHPLLGLEKLAALTQGLLVVESAIIPDRRGRQWFVGTLRPMGFVEPPGDIISPESPDLEPHLNWFVPSVSVLKAWLRAVGFGKVIAESTGRTRAIVIVHRGASPLPDASPIPPARPTIAPVTPCCPWVLCPGNRVGPVASQRKLGRSRP